MPGLLIAVALQEAHLAQGYDNCQVCNNMTAVKRHASMHLNSRDSLFSDLVLCSHTASSQ